MKIAALLAACTLSWACRSPSAPIAPLVTVRSDSTLYRTADSVRLQVTNLSDQEVQYQPCAGQFQRFNGSDWASLPLTTTLCALSLGPVAAGATSTVDVESLAGLQPGVYRLIVLRLFKDSGQTLLPQELRTSNAFRVT